MEKNSLHCTCASHEGHSCENYAERGRERKRERERERERAIIVVMMKQMQMDAMMTMMNVLDV